jgi:hypothetical protein
MSHDPAELLIEHSNWTWSEGMRDRLGRRIVDLDLHDGRVPPDLADWATAGLLLGRLAEAGVLSDVVHEADEWIVAVEIEGELRGYAADTVGDAAAWALLALWGDALPTIVIDEA